MTFHEVKYGQEQSPKQIILLLHGLGADCHNLINLAPVLIPNNESTTLFVSVNAPFPYDFAPYGYQWFSLRDWDEKRIIAEVMHASNLLAEYITNLVKRYNLSLSDLIVIGFSQGAMMALYTGLRLEERLKGIASLSGRLLNAATLQDEIKSRPRVLITHGRFDQVVPYSCLEEARYYLEQNKVPTEVYTSEAGHYIDFVAIEKIKAFIK